MQEERQYMNMRWVAVQAASWMNDFKHFDRCNDTYVSRGCASFSRGFELGAAIRDGRVGMDVALPMPPFLFSFLTGSSMFSLGSLMVILPAAVGGNKQELSQHFVSTMILQYHAKVKIKPAPSLQRYINKRVNNVHKPLEIGMINCCWVNSGSSSSRLAEMMGMWNVECYLLIVRVVVIQNVSAIDCCK